MRRTAGLVRVYLDGQDVLRFRLPAPGPFIPTCFGPACGTARGRPAGRRSADRTRNRSEPDAAGPWDAARRAVPGPVRAGPAAGARPNTHERPDNGYSSWLPLAGGEILVLDYTNQDDPLGQSHIVGCRLRAENFQDDARRRA